MDEAIALLHDPHRLPFELVKNVLALLGSSFEPHFEEEEQDFNHWIYLPAQWQARPAHPGRQSQAWGLRRRRSKVHVGPLLMSDGAPGMAAEDEMFQQ